MLGQGCITFCNAQHVTKVIQFEGDLTSQLARFWLVDDNFLR